MKNYKIYYYIIVNIKTNNLNNIVNQSIKIFIISY